MLAFVALARAMPTATQTALCRPESLVSLSKRVAADAFQRSAGALHADGGTTPPPHDCPPVHPVLRAALALFCLFVFLVLLHVWQAARYNRVHPVLGTYIADDTNDKVPCILLDDTESPS